MSMCCSITCESLGAAPSEADPIAFNWVMTAPTFPGSDRFSDTACFTSLAVSTMSVALPAKSRPLLTARLIFEIAGITTAGTATNAVPPATIFGTGERRRGPIGSPRIFCRFAIVLLSLLAGADTLVDVRLQSASTLNSTRTSPGGLATELDEMLEHLQLLSNPAPGH